VLGEDVVEVGVVGGREVVARDGLGIVVGAEYLCAQAAAGDAVQALLNG